MRLIINNETNKEAAQKKLIEARLNSDAICSFCGLIQKEHIEIQVIEAIVKPRTEPASICVPCLKIANKIIKTN